MYSFSSTTETFSPPSPHRTSTDTYLGPAHLGSLHAQRQSARKTIPSFVAQGGLRTPPSDEMGTTYQLPNVASYDAHPMHHHHHSSFAPAIAQSNRGHKPINDAPYHPSSRYVESQPVSLVSHSSTNGAVYVPPVLHPVQVPYSRQSAKTSTPGSVGTMSSVSTVTASSEQELSARDAAMVLHSLNIPTCISPNGGSLVDFTAQITALFWFESIKTLESAEQIHTLAPGTPVRRLTENAIASSHFKKWVHSVLSTTQVTQNVILLALMFIYRLKVANADVRGRPGSEFRLLTVALMLGNKFLDDNTYTNKTWAEVSGIAVAEIHVMEVEFLSNMRYSLLATKIQWEEWLVKLTKFWQYCERALQVPSPIAIPSPTHLGFMSPLPSPTGHLAVVTGIQLAPSNRRLENWPPHPASSPLAPRPELQVKKRAYADDGLIEPPAKRIAPQMESLHSSGQRIMQPHPSAQPPHLRAVPEQARLSVPNLTLNTTNLSSMPMPQPHPVVNYTPSQASALSLPPLVGGVRAMATVYPTTNYAAPFSNPATSGSTVPSSATSLTPTNTYPAATYGTPTKRTSPQTSFTTSAGYNSSPLTDPFHHTLTPIGTMGTASGTHTPMGNSPSIYLQQRPSPYKPVRHVNTLLYPPPSAFLQQYHLTNQIPPTQMHYQPLGRRNEFRTGIVPEFAMANHPPLVAPGGQHHSVTPIQPMHPLSQSQRQTPYDAAGLSLSTHHIFD